MNKFIKTLIAITHKNVDNVELGTLAKLCKKVNSISKHEIYVSHNYCNDTECHKCPFSKSPARNNLIVNSMVENSK